MRTGTGSLGFPSCLTDTYYYYYYYSYYYYYCLHGLIGLQKTL